MPTYSDETLHDRYARENVDHTARLAKLTPEQIAEMELSLHNALAEIDQLRAQLPSQGGEAVEVVARIIESPSAIFPAVELTQSGVGIWGTHDLMTVAQHQRIMAASVADPGAVAVRRKLLENCTDYMEGSASAKVRVWHEQLRALLANSEGVKS